VVPQNAAAEGYELLVRQVALGIVSSPGTDEEPQAAAALVDVIDAGEIAEPVLITATAPARRLVVILADQVPSQELTSIRVSVPAAYDRLVNGTLVSGYRCALVSASAVASDECGGLPLKPSPVRGLRNVAAQETRQWVAWGVHRIAGAFTFHPSIKEPMARAGDFQRRVHAALRIRVALAA
jgi:hypothetical protein